jgi:hypothetical protein
MARVKNAPAQKGPRENSRRYFTTGKDSRSRFVSEARCAVVKLRVAMRKGGLKGSLQKLGELAKVGEAIERN